MAINPVIMAVQGTDGGEAAMRDPMEREPREEKLPAWAREMIRGLRDEEPGLAGMAALVNDAVPVCEASLEPPGGYPPGGRARWQELDVRCDAPAVMLMGFWCPDGHAGSNLKCEAHGQDDGNQCCGYCALDDARVPVTIIVLDRWGS